MARAQCVPALLLALAAAVAAPVPSLAQDSPVQLEVEEGGGVQVRLGDLVEEGGFAGPLESGLPVRIALTVELWRDGFVDALEAQSGWRGTLVLEPLSEEYRVELESGADGGGSSLLREVVPDLTEATRLLEEAIRVPLGPSRTGRYYYLARVTVETLSASDLEELSRWLRGELGPAVEEGGGVGGALGRGIRRLMARLLGLPTQRFEVRSERFDYP